MSLQEWIYSSYPNPAIKGQWGLLHIFTLLFCVAVIITLTVIFRKKSEKTRKLVLLIIVGILIFFELARRIINLSKLSEFVWDDVLWAVMFRPWCAISSLTVMIATFTKSKFIKNFASINALICTIIFFAYPSVGFNNQYILFENLYSIATHSLLFIFAITQMTFGLTHFDYKTVWKELICFAIIFAYAFIEIFVLKIEPDPMYFMPNNEVQEILKLSYGGYLAVYIIFLCFYVSLFYAIPVIIQKIKNRKQIKQK